MFFFFLEPERYFKVYVNRVRFLVRWLWPKREDISLKVFYHDENGYATSSKFKKFKKFNLFSEKTTESVPFARLGWNIRKTPKNFYGNIFGRRTNTFFFFLYIFSRVKNERAENTLLGEIQLSEENILAQSVFDFQLIDCTPRPKL